MQAKDSRGIIIWGVPHSMPIHALSTFFLHPLGKVKRDAMKLEWLIAAGKRGNELRFVLATFGSSVERDAHFTTVKAMCAGRNWKATKSRTYSTRSRQRNTDVSTVQTAAVKQQERNIYVPLDVIDDPMIHVLGSSISDDQAPSDSADPRPLDKNDWSRLQVGSINMQGNLKAKIAELEEYLCQNRYDIVALQEVRKAGKLNVKNYRYYAKVNDKGEGGVGILVALHIDPLINSSEIGA